MYGLRLEHVYYFVTYFDTAETKASGQRVSGNETHQISEGIHLPTFTLCFSYAEKKKKCVVGEKRSQAAVWKRTRCFKRFGRSTRRGSFSQSHLNTLAGRTASDIQSESPGSMKKYRLRCFCSVSH